MFCDVRNWFQQRNFVITNVFIKFVIRIKFHKTTTTNIIIYLFVKRVYKIILRFFEIKNNVVMFLFIININLIIFFVSIFVFFCSSYFFLKIFFVEIMFWIIFFYNKFVVAIKNCDFKYCFVEIFVDTIVDNYQFKHYSIAKIDKTIKNRTCFVI